MQTQGRSLQFGSRWWRSWQRNWTRWAPQWCSRWSRTRSHPRCRSHCCRWIRSQCNSLQPWFFMFFHGFSQSLTPSIAQCTSEFWSALWKITGICTVKETGVVLVSFVRFIPSSTVCGGGSCTQKPFDKLIIGKLHPKTIRQERIDANCTLTITVTLLMHSILGSRHGVHDSYMLFMLVCLVNSNMTHHFLSILSSLTLSAE